MGGAWAHFGWRAQRRRPAFEATVCKHIHLSMVPSNKLSRVAGRFSPVSLGCNRRMAGVAYGNTEPLTPIANMVADGTRWLVQARWEIRGGDGVRLWVRGAARVQPRAHAGGVLERRELPHVQLLHHGASIAAGALWELGGALLKLGAAAFLCCICGRVVPVSAILKSRRLEGLMLYSPPPECSSFQRPPPPGCTAGFARPGTLGLRACFTTRCAHMHVARCLFHAFILFCPAAARLCSELSSIIVTSHSR